MADKHSRTPRARVASVRIGTLEVEGVVDVTGKVYVAVPQIADIFQLDRNQASRNLKRLMGDSVCFCQVASEFGQKPVNAVSIPQFAFICYRLSVAGKDKTGKASAIARSYYTEMGDAEKLSTLDGLRALEKSNHKALRARTATQRERDLQEKFAVLWRCEKEYPVEYRRSIGSVPMNPVLIGRADLVNDQRLVEIKECRQWKHAMGQLLAYQEVLQRPEIWLILFKSKGHPCREIESIVSRFGIKVKFIRN